MNYDESVLSVWFTVKKSFKRTEMQYTYSIDLCSMYDFRH